MRGTSRLAWAAPAALLCALPLLAHHSFSAEFDSGKTVTVSDPARGVIANDVNVFGVKVVGAAPAGLTLNLDGTFTYAAGVPTSFTYCGNGATSGPACAVVTLGAAPAGNAAGITCSFPGPFNSNVATKLSIKPPGVLAYCKDAAGYPLTIAASPAPVLAGGNVNMDESGGFTATLAVAAAFADVYTAKFNGNQGRS